MCVVNDACNAICRPVSVGNVVQPTDAHGQPGCTRVLRNGSAVFSALLTYLHAESAFESSFCGAVVMIGWRRNIPPSAIVCTIVGTGRMWGVD